MKFFINGTIACDVHYEKEMVKNIITFSNNEICEYIDEADYIIVIDSCIGTYKSFLEIINYLKLVNEYKREDAKIILSGYLAKGVNFELNQEQLNVLNSTIIIQSNNISSYVAELVGFEKSCEEDFDIPSKVEDHALTTSLVQGCLNNCSFCKKNYMSFDLKSIKLESIKLLVDDLNENDYPIYYGRLISSNLSLYGMDLYHEKRAHEAINLFSQINSIKYITIGALINWYPELLKEILNNPKIKQIFTSLETGSPRLYSLMNRPIPLEELINIIKTIRQERPDIKIDTEFIAGFPTENIDDIKATINLVEELGVNPAFVHPYINSFAVPASQLPQHSAEYIRYSKKYIDNKLEKYINLIYSELENDEKIVTRFYEKYNVYEVLLKNGGTRRISAKKLTRKYEPGQIILK